MLGLGGWCGTQHCLPVCHDHPLVGQATPFGGAGGFTGPPCGRQHDFCSKLTTGSGHNVSNKQLNTLRDSQELALLAIVGRKSERKDGGNKEREAEEASHGQGA